MREELAVMSASSVGCGLLVTYFAPFTTSNKKGLKGDQEAGLSCGSLGGGGKLFLWEARNGSSL